MIIDNTIKPVPNSAQPASTYPARPETPDKLAASLKIKEGSGKPEIAKDPFAVGMNIDTENIEKLKDELNRTLATPESEYQYVVDDDTKKVLFRQIDRKTGAVIRQIPPEDIVRFAKRLMELLEGKIISLKA